MKAKRFTIIIGVVLLFSLLAFSMAYTVRFNEFAIVSTFGQVSEASIVRDPGPHFKLPAPFQSVRKYDSRLQTVDTRLETHGTSDGLQVIAQAFVLWRIDSNRVLGFDSTYGSVERASSEIETRMRSAVGALSEFDFDELIGSDNRLADVEARIAERLKSAGAGSKSLAELGVDVVKVGISQMVLPVETTKIVVERMKKEKEEQAEAIRMAADAEKRRIESEAQSRAQTILDHAERIAAKIRAEGDTLASESLNVMQEDPQFATFLIWLDALERATAGATTFVIPTSFQPFHLLTPVWREGGAIPQPSRDLLRTGEGAASAAPPLERRAAGERSGADDVRGSDAESQRE